MGNVSIRKGLIIWLYLLVCAHFVAGVVLAWCSSLSLFDQYHQSILSQINDHSAAARQLQVWWVSLFGATLQNLAIIMGVLTYVANKQRNAFIWAWMIAGLLLWAPQDMVISLQIDLWIHVWVDLLALLLFVPPLFVLWRLDRKASC